MKKILIIFSVIFSIFILIAGTTQKVVNNNYLRIHIRANSNSQIDQLIKYEIKDKIVEAVTPLVASCNNLEQVKQTFNNNLLFIDSVANNILKQKGLNYVAKTKLCQEDFPTRSYNGFVLEKGFYDAIIVELGQAKGDNWWCVVYPPLCFTNATTGSNVVYKSRILEMIKKFSLK